MAFIVEDGIGISDANSYCTLEFANEFFADRFQDQGRKVITGSHPDFNDEQRLWIGEEPEKMGALVQATDHIDAVYGAYFKGNTINQLQALAFPRDLFNGIPIQLKKATCLYALRALTDHLIPDFVSSGDKTEEVVSGNVVKRREKVGPIEEETEFSKPSQGQTNKIIYYHEVLTPKSYPEADMMLKVLLKPEAIISPSHNVTPDTPEEDIGYFEMLRSIR